VVLLHGFGWTYREAAEHRGVATSTVQGHAERGMAKLRHALAAGGHRGPDPPGSRRIVVHVRPWREGRRGRPDHRCARSTLGSAGGMNPRRRCRVPWPLSIRMAQRAIEQQSVVVPRAGVVGAHLLGRVGMDRAARTAGTGRPASRRATTSLRQASSSCCSGRRRESNRSLSCGRLADLSGSSPSTRRDPHLVYSATGATSVAKRAPTTCAWIRSHGGRHDRPGDPPGQR
jgi:hypothetical protein